MYFSFFSVSSLLFPFQNDKATVPACVKNKAGFIQGYCNKEEGSSPLKQKAGEFKNSNGKVLDFCILVITLSARKVNLPTFMTRLTFTNRIKKP